MSGRQSHPTPEELVVLAISGGDDSETIPLLSTAASGEGFFDGADHKASPVPEVVIDVEKAAAKRIKEKLEDYNISNAAGRRGVSALKEKHTIYRVLPTVRREDGGSYDPNIISIGPLHRENKALHAMEGLKWEFLNDLLARSPDNSVEKYTNAVAAMEPRAREQYADELAVDPAAFVEMLVVDGCFIIELMIKLAVGDRPEQLYDVNWILPLVKNDILLAENQIPFFILNALYSKSKIGDDLAGLDLNYLAFIYLTGGSRDPPKDLAGAEFYHLLHLLQWSLRPGVEEKAAVERSWWDITNLFLARLVNTVSICLFFSISYVVFFVFLFRRRKQRPTSVDQGAERAPRMIPSATELQNSGIVFKKKEGVACFLDVSFDFGVLEIPRLSVQGGTVSQFRNLIAFEQCCPGAGNHFTSYTMFMDYLINTPEDAAALENCGIVESKLGSSEDLVIFFNTICKGGYLDYDKHYLVDVFKNVQEYCQKEHHRWRAILISTYFSSPWAMISFLGAVLAIVLTVVSTFYTVYAYYRPP